ncbi:MAG: hypothetical protein IJJ23_03620 [Clostridia bacterium]|nr:hypothetical protein [Clostridia bacterium]
MFSISLNRIHDTLRISEGTDTLILKVDGDAQRMVAGLINVRERSAALAKDGGEAALEELARYFAVTIFGEEQADKLFDFYRGNAGCVFAICSQYFSERLNKLVTKAQKKAYARTR